MSAFALPRSQMWPILLGPHFFDHPENILRTWADFFEKVPSGWSGTISPVLPQPPVPAPNSHSSDGIPLAMMGNLSEMSDATSENDWPFDTLRVRTEHLNRPTISQIYRGEVTPPEWVANCPVAQQYIELLGPLDWENFPEPDGGVQPGPVPNPRRAFASTFLLKLNEEKRYMPGTRHFLVTHPSLVWLFGFRLVPSEDSTYGFDVDASVPTARHLSRVLRESDN